MGRFWPYRFLSCPVRLYRSGQVLVVTFDDYVYLVPYVEEQAYYFLKTVIPSRKATRDYLRSNRDEKT